MPTLSIRLRVTGISGLERHAAFLQLFAASLQLRRVTSVACGSILVRCAFAAYTDEILALNIAYVVVASVYLLTRRIVFIRTHISLDKLLDAWQFQRLLMRACNAE